MDGVMLWKGSPHGVGINAQDRLAETPASNDYIPLYDTSAAEGKTVSFADLHGTLEVDGSTDITLTATQMKNTVVTNFNMSDANHYCTLPTAAAGMNALFTVGTARTGKRWGVKAGAADKIYLVAAANGNFTAGSDAGYARMNSCEVGQSFHVFSFKTGAATWDWIAKEISVGTSTFAAA